MEIPPIISVDDHIVEPPDLWTRWLPERLREHGPRVERAPYEMVPDPRARTAFRRATSGPTTDFWVYEGSSLGLDTGRAAGLVETMDNRPIAYDAMRPGCYELGPRLDDMTINHVERSMCFPTFPRFCGQTFLDATDKELASCACTRTTTGWSRNGPARAGNASSRSA